MYRFTLIWLSSTILFQSFNFGLVDVFRIDELVEHRSFHFDEYGDNFIVFLSKHYGELKQEHSKKHQEEKEDHEKLPFKHQLGASSSLVFFLDQAPIQILKIEVFLDRNSNFFYKEPYSLFEKPRVFQPPKLA